MCTKSVKMYACFIHRQHSKLTPVVTGNVFDECSGIVSAIALEFLLFWSLTDMFIPRQVHQSNLCRLLLLLIPRIQMGSFHISAAQRNISLRRFWRVFLYKTYSSYSTHALLTLLPAYMITVDVYCQCSFWGLRSLSLHLLLAFFFW